MLRCAAVCLLPNNPTRMTALSQLGGGSSRERLL
jgi:hypothetical protein